MAARYAQAPPRAYSCSTRAGWPGRGGKEACLRMRAWMLVFSSVESTNSSPRRERPSQCLAYRSRMRSAFEINCGSRGKIQVRCCQGRIASSCNHRQTVLSLKVATMPERCASRTISAELKRESGTPSVTGNSHAMAFTCTTTSGGKNRGAARPGSLLQSWQSLMEEPLAPETDHIASDVQGCADFIIGSSLCSQQNHLGAQDLEIRQRIFSSAAFQNFSFLFRERDLKRASSGHPDRPPLGGR